MKSNRFISLYFLILIQSFFGCSSDFIQPFPMPLIPLNDDVKKVGGAPEIYLQEIKDTRKSKVFFEYDNSKYETNADIGPVAREALSKTLVKQGYRYSSNANFIFNLNITKWDAIINDSFLGTATAEAEIKMTLLNRQGQKLYSGTYRGISSAEGISYDSEDIAEILGSSMKAAISELSNDKKLERLLLKR